MSEHKHNLPARFVYNGEVIRDRNEMLSLTDMWKAAGADPSKRPVEWLRSKGARSFIEVLSEMVGKSHLFDIGTGRNARTFAHWQIALAYAKYLSPDFHMWCNEVVRERMEGRVSAQMHLPSDVEEFIRRTDGIARMLAHKVSEIEKALPAIVNQSVEAAIAADPRVAVLDYVAVRQILNDEWKVPSKGRRSIQQKVLLRLRDHCLRQGIKARRCARTNTWLFPPEEAKAFIRDNCAALIREHLDRVKGQVALRLVGGRAA